MTISITVYRVETLRGTEWKLWREFTDYAHADMVYTQLRQSPAFDSVRCLTDHRDIP